MKFSMKKRALALACAAALAAALLAGCGPQQETPSSSGGETTDAIVLTDGTGREVTLSAPAERIVSACYPATATLIALGAAERVVGVEDGAAARELYRRAAPALQELPAVTGSDGVDTAAAAALEPDLVILPADQTEQAAAFDELGIPCVVLPWKISTTTGGGDPAGNCRRRRKPGGGSDRPPAGCHGAGDHPLRRNGRAARGLPGWG